MFFCPPVSFPRLPANVFAHHGRFRFTLLFGSVRGFFCAMRVALVYFISVQFLRAAPSHEECPV